MTDDKKHQSLSTNNDFSRSYTHERPAPDTRPPTSRASSSSIGKGPSGCRDDGVSQNFEDLKPKIIEELNKRAPNLKCTTCESRKMILIDGFLNRPLQKEISENLIMGRPAVPTVAIVCENCGHVMEFSAGILGVLKNNG